jgi:two-component sensor histidine kinase
MEEGMNSNAVWSLTEDTNGRIWVGTAVGLQAINTRTMQPEQFAVELAEPGIGNCGILPDGTLWGVSANRLMLYELQHEVRRPVPPPVHLRRVYVNETAVSLQGPHTFAHSQNNCRIEFVGPSFRDEKAVRYAYRLLGLDERWREPTPLREVTYASLSPGDYTFQVKAISKDGVESAVPASFVFRISPPFWITWWFIAAAILLVSGLIVTVIRIRVRRLLEIERIRTGIATDLHDDIGSGLTRIAILSDVAAKHASGVSEANEGRTLPDLLEKMGTSARELHDAMSDVVWSIDPKHDTVENIVGRLRVFAHELCDGMSIALRFDEDPSLQSVKLSPQTLRSLLLIGKEALTNAVRHSGCNTISVQVQVEHNVIVVSISDDGRGFTEGMVEGNGLSNMKKRATKAGGRVSVASRKGQGTRVEARIPARA